MFLAPLTKEVCYIIISNYGILGVFSHNSFLTFHTLPFTIVVEQGMIFA
jgi:hypothetical protein